jgi:hypothetical protein
MTDVLILALAPLLFLSVLLMIELGHLYRLRSRLPNDPESNAVLGPAIGTVLALMGLVLAFSFSNAAGRLDASRKTILDEANAIDTAWLRIDLAEPGAQPRLKELFRQYVDARIQAYEASGLPEYRHQLEIGTELLSQIWALAEEAIPASRPQDRMLLLTAVNTMSDGASARTLSLSTHLPPAVFVFLLGNVLLGSMLIGTILASAGGRLWFYRLVIAAVLSLTVYAIVDMEYPRLGAFNLLKDADAQLVSLRKVMR